MKSIEKLLQIEKMKQEQIDVPVELEDRLKSALFKTNKPRLRKNHVILIAAAAILLLFVTYQYSALAYYGKKILGFDDIMTTTLSELNEKGLGQTIEKTYTLEDGIQLTINGIISDENRFILYYTLVSKEGLYKEDFEDYISFDKLTGFFTNANSYAGIMDMKAEENKISGSMEFEPVSLFAKKLTLHYYQYLRNGEVKKGTITFPYKSNEALETSIKQSIRKKVEVDKGSITFQSITATPSQTVIDGTLNVENFRMPLPLSGIQLIANGKEIDSLGAGVTTSLTGKKFNIRYDALPENLDTLQLLLSEFAGYRELNKTIDLTTIDKNQSISIGDKDLWITNIQEMEKQIQVTIRTNDDVLLDDVYLLGDKEDTELETTVGKHQIQGEEKMVSERTLIFPAIEAPNAIRIGGMHYTKNYQIEITIPVKKSK